MHKIIFTVLVIFLFCYCLPSLCKGQGFPIFSLEGEYATCEDNSSIIQIPLFVENLSDLSALTLNILMDSTALKFEGISHPNSRFNIAGGQIVNNYNTTNGAIAIVWFSMKPLPDITDRDTLFVINVKKLHSENAPLTFLEKYCEIAYSDMSVDTTVSYVNGITQTIKNISIVQTTQSGEQEPLSILKLSVQQYDNFNYQWQQQSGNIWNNITDNNSGITGSTTPTLIFNPIYPENNNKNYRCILTAKNDSPCIFISNEHYVTINLDNIEEISGEKKHSVVTLLSNPINNGSIEMYYTQTVGSTTISITDLMGNKIFHQFFDGFMEGSLQTIPFMEQPCGTYIITLYNQNQLMKRIKIIKQ